MSHGDGTASFSSLPGVPFFRAAASERIMAACPFSSSAKARTWVAVRCTPATRPCAHCVRLRPFLSSCLCLACFPRPRQVSSSLQLACGAVAAPCSRQQRTSPTGRCVAYGRNALTRARVGLPRAADAARADRPDAPRAAVFSLLLPTHCRLPPLLHGCPRTYAALPRFAHPRPPPAVPPAHRATT